MAGNKTTSSTNEKTSVSNTKVPAGPTGMFLGVDNITWYGIIIGIAIIGLLVYAFRKKIYGEKLFRLLYTIQIFTNKGNNITLAWD